jgi:hypothetical protein
MKEFPVARIENIVVQNLDKELLIYDLTTHQAYCLNETSALIYQLCDGNNSIEEINRQLSKKLNSSVTDDLIWLALDQLKKDNLLADSNEIEINFNGLSRREAIRKVGLATMIAMPTISSLMAPTAAMAQSAGSCNSIGQACTGAQSVGSCCSGSFCNAIPQCQTCRPDGAIVLCGSNCTDFEYQCCSGSASPGPVSSGGICPVGSPQCFCT